MKMNELIKKQLLNAQEYGFKVKITLLDSFHHYGFVKEADDEFVLINLEQGNKEVTIKLSNINEVVVYR